MQRRKRISSTEPEPHSTIGAQELLNDSGVVRSGLLRRRGNFDRRMETFILTKAIAPRIFKWRRRFLIISEQCLYIYADEQAALPTSSHSLAKFIGVERAPDIRPDLHWCFVLVPHNSSDKLQYFACTSIKEQKEWMKNLNSQMRLAHDLQPLSDFILNDSDISPLEARIQEDVGMKSASLPNLLSEVSVSPSGTDPERRNLRHDRPLPQPRTLPATPSAGFVEDDDDDTRIYDTIDPDRERRSWKDILMSLMKRKNQSNHTKSPDYVNVNPSDKIESKDVKQTKGAYDLADAPGSKPPTAPKPKPKHKYDNAAKVPVVHSSRSVFFMDVTDSSVVKQVLKVRQNGAFLVRPSKSNRENEVLSVLIDGDVKEFRIFKIEAKVSLDHGTLFSSVEDLIEYYLKVPLPNKTQSLSSAYTLSVVSP